MCPGNRRIGEGLVQGVEMTKKQAAKVIEKGLIPYMRARAFGAKLFDLGDRGPFAIRDHNERARVTEALHILTKDEPVQL